MKRSSIQRTGKGLKRSGTLSRGSGKLSGGGPIKRKQKTQAEKDQQSADIERMWKLFDEHWKLKGEGLIYRMCESCQDSIWGENKSLYHDHLLEKSRYPELKYEMDNLALVCTECHTKKTAGSPTEKHRGLIEQAKKRFNI